MWPKTDDRDDRIMEKEPVLILLAGLAGVLDLGVVAANALEWLHLDGDQTAALVAFITAVTALIAAVTRASVYSPSTVKDIEHGDPLIDGEAV